MAFPKECQVCEFLQKHIENMQKTQENRPCGEHTNRIEKMEKETEKQWVAISDLQQTVWGWKGAMGAWAFAGSIFGTIAVTIIHYLIRRL